jgi:hypothetical protein
MLTPVASLAASEDTGPAIRAWLALVDAGRYAESWAAAGTIFKTHISRTGWPRMVAGVRAPLGRVLSRTFIGDERSNSLPGAPDGYYDVAHFRTVFAHKATAEETVVMARQPDGWRVGGYFIR